MAVREQDREKSECRPVIGRIGVETLLHAKAGRRSRGLSSQESFENHLNERKANGRCNMGVCTFRRDEHYHVRWLKMSIVKVSRNLCNRVSKDAFVEA
jgi:hypothetical protein